MDREQIKEIAHEILRKWWCSILLIPFIIYSIHQGYWTLRFNIYFAINYEFPFPINAVNFLVDNFLLIVHEAGHTFFRIFGSRTITILGGSLFQILLPLFIFSYSWVNRQRTGIQLSLYLIGFSFMEVGYYAADAGKQQLPLIGDLSKNAHDWYNLLSNWGILESDLLIGVLLAICGILSYILALLTPLFFKKYEKADVELSL